jgi:broad specificity phosphatase PhoE
MTMPVEMTISTLRHAHTQYNAEKRYAGTIDIPLSEAGICDARKAAEKLNGVKFDVVVTSTQKRAFETARILVGDAVPIVRTELCNERCFGVMEGLTWDEIQSLQPPIMTIRVGNDLHTVNPKGGEPFEDVWERAKRFRRLLFKEYKGSAVLVVSHGVFLQMFHGVLKGSSCIESLANYPSNLELSRFRFSGHRLVDQGIVQFSDGETYHW